MAVSVSNLIFAYKRSLDSKKPFVQPKIVLLSSFSFPCNIQASKIGTIKQKNKIHNWIEQNEETTKIHTTGYDSSFEKLAAIFGSTCWVVLIIVLSINSRFKFTETKGQKLITDHL